MNKRERVILEPKNVQSFMEGQNFIAKSKYNPKGIKYTYWGVDKTENTPYNIKLTLADNQEQVCYVRWEWFMQRDIIIEIINDEDAEKILREWQNINSNNRSLRSYSFLSYRSNDSIVFEYSRGNHNVRFRVSFDEVYRGYNVIVQRHIDNEVFISKPLFCECIELLNYEELLEWCAELEITKVG